MTPAMARTLARYNAWQNRSMLAAAGGLEPSAREADLGAFFGSIHATFSHLLWADRMWMSRLLDWEKPAGGIAESPRHEPDWERLLAARAEADGRIVAWAEGLAGLERDLIWWSGAAGREVRRPAGLCALHMFNHQTHHRGQIHAMLTAAGARPGDTDLFLMPSG